MFLKAQSNFEQVDEESILGYTCLYTYISQEMYKYMEQIQFCLNFCEFYSGIKKCRVSWAQEHFWKTEIHFMYEQSM